MRIKFVVLTAFPAGCSPLAARLADMRAKLVVLTAGLSLLAAAPLLAHHSFDAEFGRDKPVTLKGVVTKVEWMNPHTWLYIDVTDENGNVTHWQCEGGSPNQLVRRGWKKDSLKPGDQVIVEGYRAKDRANTANAREVRLPDGRKVYSGLADDAGQASRDATKQ